MRVGAQPAGPTPLPVTDATGPMQTSGYYGGRSNSGIVMIVGQ